MVNVNMLKTQEQSSKICSFSGQSSLFKTRILPLMLGKDGKDSVSVKDSNILLELLKNIFVGDEVSIKDNFACLVAYLALHGKDVTYDIFVRSYESMKMSCATVNEICCVLPYGSLIASGLIFKWKPEQINLTIYKLLKLYQKDPETISVVFHFLVVLINNIKTVNTYKLKKIKIDSLIQLYFLLCADFKRDEDSIDSPIFDSDNVLDLSDVFMHKSEDQELVSQVSGLLAKKLLALPEEIVITFWGRIMESYSTSRTDCKELAILHLLVNLLELYEQTEFPILQLFTPTVIRILSKNSPKIEHVFKRINMALKKLSEKLSGETKLCLINVIILNAEKLIEKVLVVKLCETLTISMIFDEISAVVEYYKQIITGEKHKAKHSMKFINNDFNEYEKIYAVRCIGKLIGHNSCKHEVKWRKEQIKFLFKIGFLSEYTVSIPPHLAGISRKVFYTCLNQKFSKLTDLNEVLKKLVKFAGLHVGGGEEKFVVPFKDQAVNLWRKTKGIIKSLDRKNEEDDLVFKILFQYMMLLMFSSYPLAKSSLEELFKVIENKELNSCELHWTEVTIDLFLHLLSGDNNPHRNVINSTFGYICKHMTSKGLELILSSVKGKVNEEDQMDEEDNKDVEFSSDVENSSEDDSNELDSDAPEGNDGQIDRLKDALRQELYKIDTASTCGSVDLDNLDPEEGRQLNSTLGEIFKGEHGGYKTSAKKRVDNLEIHFRIRALELLELYIENKPSLYSSTIILSAAISLLKTSIPNHTLAPFTVNLKKCLKKLTSLKEFSNCDNVTDASMFSILNEIMNKDCPTSVYHDMTEQLIDSCLFLFRASSQLSEDGEEISNFFKNASKDFFTEVDSPIPFQLLTSLFSSLSFKILVELVAGVIDFAFSSKLKPHKKTQALQLLITFYNNNRLFKSVSGFEIPLKKIEKRILDKSIKLLNMSSEMNELNKKYICMFLDLLCLLKRKEKNDINGHGPEWDKVTKLIPDLFNIPLFKNELKLSFSNFCKIFNCNKPENNNSPIHIQSKKEKRKSSEIISTSVTGSVNKKRKK